MTSAVRGTTPGRDVAVSRTIISHRDFAEADDDVDDVVSSPAPKVLGDADAALQEAIDDSIIDDADEVFNRAASATPLPSTERPAPTTRKPARSAKTRTPKPSTSATTKKGPAKSKTTWAGETGPDNSVTVDGEQQWEIEAIVGQEGPNLLVKWKGWKGVWEEDYVKLAESAPELVKEWEAVFLKAAKARAGVGRPKNTSTTKAAAKGKPKAATARQAAATRKVVKKGPKVTREPKKATAAPKRLKKKAASTPKKTASTPKKTATTPKKSPRKVAGRGAVGAAKKRGR